MYFTKTTESGGANLPRGGSVLSSSIGETWTSITGLGEEWCTHFRGYGDVPSRDEETRAYSDM